MATQGVTAIQKRRTLWQWLKGYTGQKYMTTALFLAIPVALLILFTIIPAVNMIIFSFQQRDQLGVNVQDAVYRYGISFNAHQQLVLLCRLVYTARTCTFHRNSVMLENKVRRTVQGSYLLPLSYERRCGSAYLPEILQRR